MHASYNNEDDNVDDDDDDDDNNNYYYYYCFNIGNSVICTVNSESRIAATLYYIET